MIDMTYTHSQLIIDMTALPNIAYYKQSSELLRRHICIAPKQEFGKIIIKRASLRFLFLLVRSG